jgi:anti-sigma factor RsiW
MPRVSALHDGELTGEQSLLLCAHVQTCQACGEMLAFMETVSTSFSTADPGELLRLAPRQAEPDRPRRRPIDAPADVRWARRLTAAAAALFLAAVGRSVYLQYNAGSGLVPTDPFQHPVNRVVPGASSPASLPAPPTATLDNTHGQAE